MIESWGATPVLLVQPSILQSPYLANHNVILYYKTFGRDWGVSHEQYFRLYKEFRQIVRDIARETGALLVDLDKGISPDRDNFSDLVHLNTKGSKTAANLITNVLKKKIQECLERTGRVKCFGPTRNNR